MAGSFTRAIGCLVIAAALVSAGSASAAPGARSGETLRAITAARYAPDREECRFLRLINDYRAEHGRGPLTLSRTLGAAADHHSRDMAARDYFSHTLSTGASWRQNIANHGYPSDTTRGENIAAGYSSATSTFNQWVNSSPHRRNMLNGDFRAIGIGRHSGAESRYGWYWTTTFGSDRHRTIECP